MSYDSVVESCSPFRFLNNVRPSHCVFLTIRHRSAAGPSHLLPQQPAERPFPVQSQPRSPGMAGFVTTEKVPMLMSTDVNLREQSQICILLHLKSMNYLDYLVLAS